MNLILGVILLLTGIAMLVMDSKGQYFVFYLFGIIPIPLSFWMPIAMTIFGVYLMIR